MAKVEFQLEKELAFQLNVLEKSYLRSTLTETVKAMNRHVGLDPVQPVDQDQVFQALEKCKTWLEAYCARCAQKLTPLEWLWYLRRTGPIFRGELSTTGPYDKALAETVANLYGQSEAIRVLRTVGQVLTFEINSKVARRIGDLSIGIRLLSDIHSQIRWCGKGSDFEFSSVGLLTSRPDANLKSAVELYDKRVADLGASLGLSLAGTVLGTAVLDKVDVIDRNYDILVLSGCEPYTATCRLESGVAEYLANYLWIPVDLKELSRLNRVIGEKWWKPGAVFLLTLLMVADQLINSVDPQVTISLLHNGYFLVRKETVGRVLNEQFVRNAEIISAILPGESPPRTLQQLRDGLGIIQASLWPLRVANPIKEFNDQLLIDLATATNQLQNILEYPNASDDLGNRRALHFEDIVQACINDTSWRPSNNLLALRRLPLLQHKKVWTDFDAVGSKGDTLLMVDCISLLHQSAYSTGHPSVIKNASDKLIAKTVKWQKRRTELIQEPTGDNFDFSGFSNVIAVVCSPEPFFTPIGVCTEEASSGLQLCCSLAELKKFLAQN